MLGKFIPGFGRNQDSEDFSRTKAFRTPGKCLPISLFYWKQYFQDVSNRFELNLLALLAQLMAEILICGR